MKPKMTWLLPSRVIQLKTFVGTSVRQCERQRKDLLCGCLWQQWDLMLSGLPQSQQTRLKHRQNLKPIWIGSVLKMLLCPAVPAKTRYCADVFPSIEPHVHAGKCSIDGRILLMGLSIIVEGYPVTLKLLKKFNIIWIQHIDDLSIKNAD